MKKFVNMTIKCFTFMFGLLFVSNTILMVQSTYAQEAIPQFLYGIVSWYGDDFAGKQTASGEIYSPSALTAAHRSLPFGTRVEIENLSNGKKVEVIVNDRGPSAQNRIFDVSKQAADVLGILDDGTTFIKATILELGTSLPSPVQNPSTPIGQDIPQGFNPNVTPTNNIPPLSTTPVASNDTAMLDEDLNALFADAEEELQFMDDDDLKTQPSELRTQELPGLNQPPAGFANTDDLLIDDPLANLTLGDENEFVAAPLPPDAVLKTAPKAFTTNTSQEPFDDPFADLFDEPSDPYTFQQQRTIVSPSEPVTITNYTAPVTNIVTLPGEQVTITNNVPPSSSVIVDPATTTVTFPKEQVIVTNNMSPSSSIIIDPTATVLEGDNYIIQVGAFTKQKYAMEIYGKLRKEGLNAFITDVKIKGKSMIRVRVGYFKTIDEAISISQRITDQFKLENRIIKVEY
ncbi:MAG: septal ring lytic transglycosylase RlpA family protein [Brevinema sp.]